MKYSYATTIKEPNNTITQISYQVDRVLHTNYITVPVVVKFKFGEKHRLFMLGGIYEAVALNFKIIEASVKHTITTYSFVGQFLTGRYVENNLSTGYLNRFDFGGMGGLGFDLPFNRNWSIGMDVRMAIGLINIPAKKSDYGFLSFGANSKNINFESGVRISYSIK